HPRRSPGISLASPLQYLKTTYLVILRRFQSLIHHRLGFSEDSFAHAELMLTMSGFPNGHPELPGFVSDLSANQQHIAQVRVASLIKGAKETNTGLDRFDHTFPRQLLSH